MNRFLFYGLIVVTLLIVGCSTLPTYRIQPPWNRILGEANKIPLGSVISVKVTGETQPLLGNEELTAKEIKGKATDLLLRRGYRINDNNYQYEMVIKYKTIKEIKNYSYQGATTGSSSAALGFSAYSYNRSYFGYGVSIAQAIGALAATSSKTASTNISYDYESYCHILAFEALDLNRNLVWKADVTWNSRELDVLRNIITAMQTVFSSLPSDLNTIPNVAKLKENRYSDFINQYIENLNFNSPALPYNTRFYVGQTTYATNSYYVSGLKSKNALMAFIDLLQTAEFAVPGNDTSDWKNPMNPQIWTTVTLGGKYTLGENKEPVNVIIRLKSDVNGYLVESCSVVSDTVYEQFLTNMNMWKQVLQDYYSFYE
jgi:hypothetical protein